MSNTKREPLLSDKDINDPKLVIPLGAKMIRDIYEAARAKDAELIQQLMDALEWVAAYDNGCPLPTWEKGYNNAWSIANSARAAAEAAGFKPSDE
jgi:hypothetical protein